MSFLLQSDRYKDQIRAWSGSQAPLILRHYFWKSGTPEQRSLAGFAQASLYQILEEDRHLISTLFKPIERRSAIHRYQTRSPNAEPVWTPEQLIKLLPEAISKTYRKVYLHVDGLDECDALPGTQVAALIADICSRLHVKALVAGRPMVEHAKYFTSGPTLPIHTLTFNDISIYISEKCLNDPCAGEILLQEPSQGAALLSDLVIKADGVFVWAESAVNSVIYGSDNEETLAQLSVRVQELPPDLFDLYRHLLV